MTARQAAICAHLPTVEVLADVGCDHGYMTQFALKNGLCKRAYLVDVSRESLKKAETLLAKEIAAGRCFSLCADGVKELPEPPDCVLIAGMGGEEILKIFEEGFLPSAFVLQPMKNAEKVRAYLVERGCAINADYTFYDGKWYDIIVGSREGSSRYSRWDILFGRDNLLSPSEGFLRKIRKEEGELKRRLEGSALSQSSRETLRARLNDLEVITNAIDDDL